jgi:hypothetical protein
MTGPNVNEWRFARDLSERIRVIEVVANHFDGVDELQHLLEGLVDFLETNPDHRHEAVDILCALAAEMLPGSVEILEFSMRALRWPEVQLALQATVESATDFRVESLAMQALEVYDEFWSGGEIYRWYRNPADQ